jgi:hypothetical protein
MKKKERQLTAKRVKHILSTRIVKTKKQLASIVNVNPQELRVILEEQGICLMPKRWHTENEILRAYKKYKKPEHIAEITGLQPPTVIRYKSRLDILLNKKKKRKRVNLRDRLISQGRTMEFIGKREAVTREAIRQYILRTRQYNRWVKQTNKREKGIKFIQQYKKQAKKQKKENISRIIRTVIEYKRGYIYEDKWAIEKTNKYLSAHPNSEISFAQIYNVLHKYHKAKQQGIKLSLKQLGAEVGINFATLGNILKKINLKPLHGTLKRTSTPKWKKQAMKRAYDFPVSCLDIAYFLKLPAYLVYQNMKRWYGKRPQYPFPLAPEHRDNTMQKLTYAKASQIYEAQDLEFSKKQTAELTNMSNMTIDYCNQHKEIKTKIINLIELLYQTKTNKPYLDGPE